MPEESWVLTVFNTQRVRAYLVVFCLILKRVHIKVHELFQWLLGANL